MQHFNITLIGLAAGVIFELQGDGIDKNNCIGYNWSAMKQIAVIGASSPDRQTLELAYKVGKLIASKGAVLICGGLAGVMESACRGAKEAGGLTVGILPQAEREYANAYVDIVICTGIGYARNVMVAYSGDIVVALPGQYGTLSEIAFALSVGKTVLGLGTWKIPGVEEVADLQALSCRIEELLSKI